MEKVLNWLITNFEGNPEDEEVADKLNQEYYKVANTKVGVSYADTEHTVTQCFLEMLKWM